VSLKVIQSKRTKSEHREGERETEKRKEEKGLKRVVLQHICRG